MNNEKRKTGGRFSLAMRMLAAVLAVTMIVSIIDLFNRSRVTMDADSYVEKDYRVASRELMRDNPYAGDTRIGQMSAFVRNLLSGHHSFEDVELGVQISISQGQYDDAITLTQQSISLYPAEDETKGRLYLRLGYLYVMKNDPEHALPWLDSGIALAPSPEAYLTRGQVKLDLGNMEAAVQDADIYRATAANPDELVADMVNIYEAAGEYETAAGMYTTLIGRTGDSGFLLNRMFCLTNLGRMAEAEEDRERYAAAGGTELGSADVMLGLGWMRVREYARADDCFVRATGENYRDPDSLYYYTVLCAYMTENHERVCTYGDQLIERVLNGGSTDMADISVEKRTGRLNVTLVKMDLASLYQMNGASHLAMGHYELAAERMTACLAENPEAVYAHYLRGACLTALGRFAEAIPDFDAAIAADTEPERSHFSRGHCRQMTGDKAGAREDFEWVVENGRNDEWVREARRQLAKLSSAGGTDSSENAAEDTAAAEETEISGN